MLEPATIQAKDIDYVLEIDSTTTPPTYTLIYMADSNGEIVPINDTGNNHNQAKLKVIDNFYLQTRR